MGDFSLSWKRKRPLYGKMSKMDSSVIILLVDESRFFLAIERQFLRKTPAEVIEIENGEDALRACREHSPALVFLSFRLPDAQGPDICRKIKDSEDLNSISVVIVCDTNQDWQIEESRKAGCDEILVKPLDRHQFLEIGSRFVQIIRSPRQACLIPVGFRSARGEFRGKCLDISTGGLFLQCSEKLSEEEKIDIDLTLPIQPPEAVSCQGLVAWLNDKDHPLKPHFPVGYGIRFLNISDPEKRYIQKFMDGDGRFQGV